MEVSPTGLPVFSCSVATSASASASIAAAILSRWSIRSPGVVCFHSANAASAAWQAESTSSWRDSGAVR